jgi:16S rRNA (cytosine1402-N4)-methyltransferase
VSAAPWQHTTVLLHEAIDALVTNASGTYVDGTFGRGGHARLLLQCLAPDGRLVALDRDPEAVAAARAGATRVDDPRFSIHHANFTELSQVLAAMGIAKVDGVLLDLGVSSPQIDNPARGFSFRLDGPLDMRMDPTRGESAAQFLARADERAIAEVIRDYGEERFAVSIAKALVARREGGHPVRTTAELSQLVARAVRTREAGQDPATRTFQALRIFVNAELEALEQALSAALWLLKPQGRLAVIAFHSLEDRIVKAVRSPTAGAPARDRTHQAERRRDRGQPAQPLGHPARGRKNGSGMTRTNMLLALALLISSLYLVRTAYDSRRLFAELDKSKNEAAQLDTEFKRLEAEREAQATNLRVERTAREKLAMRTATPAVTVYVNGYVASGVRR